MTEQCKCTQMTQNIVALASLWLLQPYTCNPNDCVRFVFVLKSKRDFTNSMYSTCHFTQKNLQKCVFVLQSQLARVHACWRHVRLLASTTCSLCYYHRYTIATKHISPTQIVFFLLEFSKKKHRNVHVWLNEMWCTFTVAIVKVLEVLCVWRALITCRRRPKSLSKDTSVYQPM